MAIDDLFGMVDGPALARKAPDSGLLVTNHLNLFYMLSAGLIFPPIGFGGKYYQDTLCCFPGWIPLFVDKVSRRAIDYSTTEAEHLKPVLIEIELSGLSGEVAVYREESIRRLRFPEQLDGAERIILVPAPLPGSRIRSIVYPSRDDKRFCETDAKDFGNVPIKDFKGRANKALFDNGPAIPWPPAQGPPERDTALQTPLAAGGVLAMLLHVGNRGEVAADICRRAFDPGDASAVTIPDPLLANIPEWMEAGTLPSFLAENFVEDSDDIRDEAQKTLFWGSIERLLDWRERGCIGNVEDMLLDFLSETAAGLDSRVQSGTRTLCDTLSSLTGLANARVSTLLERHPTPMARAMILSFLRHDCADLLDFSHDALREPDWVMAAVLFGARDGWQRLPLPLRAASGLSDAVSHRMARMAHRIARTRFDLGDAPARVASLRELFGDGSHWRRMEQSAALDLARTQKWDCIDTRISLGRGEYNLSVSGGSAHIDMRGEPKVTARINIAKFLDHLAESRLEPKIEEGVRKRLRG